MKSDIENAKYLLLHDNYTCVLVCDGTTYTSRERGVKPLLSWLAMDKNFLESVVADKVVGKAAAFLYVLLKVKSVYAAVISEPAYKVLKDNNISIEYGQKVVAIRNRDNTGFCPMESAVLHMDDPHKAYSVILSTRAQLLHNKISG